MTGGPGYSGAMEREEREPDEVPTDEQLDVEGPNESTQPSDGPLGDDGGTDDEGGADAA